MMYSNWFLSDIRATSQRLPCDAGRCGPGRGAACSPATIRLIVPPRHLGSVRSGAEDLSELERERADFASIIATRRAGGACGSRRAAAGAAVRDRELRPHRDGELGGMNVVRGAGKDRDTARTGLEIVLHVRLDLPDSALDRVVVAVPLEIFTNAVRLVLQKDADAVPLRFVRALGVQIEAEEGASAFPCRELSKAVL
jgi:hypothetical protein